MVINDQGSKTMGGVVDKNFLFSGPKLVNSNGSDAASIGSTLAALTPAQSHSLKHDKSILALVVSSTCIYAGTEGGEILVYSLANYNRVKTIHAHRGSVLGLSLAQDEKLLFSSAGDRFVNVWDTSTFRRVYSIYSTYDVGDIFCVSYSSKLNIVYLGAQNTSIQWYDLNEKDSRPPLHPKAHPRYREDRFFDSSGPGGIRTPRPEYPDSGDSEGQDLEIDRRYAKQFAHFGYVFCMLLMPCPWSDNPDSELLVSGGGDGSIRLWSLDRNNHGAIKQLHSLEDGREEGDSVLSLAFDGNFLISGRLEGEINIWDLETRQNVRSLRTRMEDVIALSVGGGFLFAAGANGIVEKFDRQYERVSRFRAHNGRVLASAFSKTHGSSVYITGGSDQSITLWEGDDDIEDVDVESRTSNEKLVHTLGRFVALPTVSSDSRYQTDCRRGASFLRTVFKSFGATVETLPLENPQWNPVIFAVFKGNPSTAKDRKRILFYGHYDVIPAEDPEGKWQTNPFHMEGVDGNVYGRGTSDNKGPLLAAIFAVGELLAEKSLDSDIVFLVEGEEECGSRGFEQLVRKCKSRIGHIDWVLLANSYWLDDYVPCLTYGLRGVVHATLKVTSDRPDLHSGVDGSALVDESLKDLVLLLNSLAGRKGRVQLPGFYDPILPLTESEAALYKDITSALLERNPTLGDPIRFAKTLQQRWREASLTIHRFGTSGPENSTIIPRHARAAISLRLVPNQEATKIAEDLKQFLNDQFESLESRNHFEISIDHMAEPWLGDFNNEIYKTLEEGVMRAWSGSDQTNGQSNGNGRHLNGSHPDRRRRPLYIREGGSIPAIRFLEKEFNAPAAHLPCGQASDNAHLDNEKLRLLNLYKSKDVFKWVFRELPTR